VSKSLVGRYDLIAYEALNVKGLVEGNLAESIMDAAGAILLFQIRNQAESTGAYATGVNPRGHVANLFRFRGERSQRIVSTLARLPALRSIVKPAP
jgi:hypothetical protein